MNEEPNQIVTELRYTLESAGLIDCDGPDAIREADRIIQSAIEKATEKLWERNERLSEDLNHYAELESRAAHASETNQIAAEALAKQFHETYERLAPAFNYDTRKESAKPWEQVPDTNKKLMIAVCAEIQDTFIQSAIEKALESPKNVAALKAIYDKGVLHGRADESRAARASEQGANTKRLIELLRGVHTWFMQQAPERYNGCGLWIDVDEELAGHPRKNCILNVDSPTLPPEKDEYLQCGCVKCRAAASRSAKKLTQ